MIGQRQTSLPQRATTPSAVPTVARTRAGPHHELRRLQRTHGNRHVQRVLGRRATAPPLASAELTVGRADGPYERAADHAADLALDPSAADGRAPASRPRDGGGGRYPLDPGVARDIAGAQGGGYPLPDDVRVHLEDAYGAALDHVRVHTGGRAHGLSDAVGARAFAVGRDVFFGRGEYRPDTDPGRWLIAHELAHVVQQDGAVLHRAALTRDELNVVGEDHSVSDKRRPAEAAFAKQETGSENYWTEAEFREPQQQPPEPAPEVVAEPTGTVPARSPEPARGPASGTEPADRWEYRAAHAAAVLLKHTDDLIDDAMVALKDPNDTGFAYLKQALDAYAQKWLRLRATWVPQPTPSPMLEIAKEVFTAVETAVTAYRNATADASTDPDQKREAVEQLHSKLVAVYGPAVRKLAEATGMPPGGDQAEVHADDVEEHISRMRSAAMGRAARNSKEVGVWKVGDHHIRDLVGEQYQANRVNLVTAAAFNKDFEPWDTKNRQDLTVFQEAVARLARVVERSAYIEPETAEVLAGVANELLQHQQIQGYAQEQNALLGEAHSAVLSARKKVETKELRKRFDLIAGEFEERTAPRDRAEPVAVTALGRQEPGPAPEARPARKSWLKRLFRR